MSPAETEALTRVVNYLLPDEQKNYGKEPREGHIFLDLKVLQEHLQRQ